MAKKNLRSVLHLQMGQEVLYLIMTLGIMTSIVLMIYAGLLQSENTDLKAQREAALAEAKALRAQVASLSEELKNRPLPAPKPPPAPPTKPDDQPPIITLGEAEGYYFPSGSATISEDFRKRIGEKIVPKIVEISDRYDAEVIEVIGHTDEVPLRTARSTIDKELLAYLNRPDAPEPSAADNVGLGMIRAAAVARVLEHDPRLSNFVILVLSAGQTTTTQHRLSPGLSPPRDDQLRRRIEIRVRRRFQG